MFLCLWWSLIFVSWEHTKISELGSWGVAIIAVTWPRLQGSSRAAQPGEESTHNTGNFPSHTIWVLNLVVPFIIMLLIKRENNLILFPFLLLEAQSITFSYIKHQGHRHSAVHGLGTGGPRSWKIGNTSTFLEMITIPTHVYKLVEWVLFPRIKWILMQEIKMHF